MNVRFTLFVDGMYLMETADEPGNWWMGERRDHGTVFAWGKYGSLDTAIANL